MEQGLITNSQKSLSEIEVIKSALQTPKVSNAIPYEIAGAISMGVDAAIFFLGLKTPTEDRDAIKLTAISDVKKAFSHLTTGELSVAIDSGVRGKYGPVIGLSPKDIYNWILAYSNSHERKLGKVEIEVTEQSKEPTPNEKFTTGKQLCVDLYENFKKCGQLDRTTLSVYDFLKSVNLIDPDYKKGIYKEALTETVKEKNIEIALCVDIYKRRVLKSQLECLTENITNDILTVEQNDEVLRTGRKMILKNILIDMAMDDQNMAELIEMKRAIYIK